jgi:hypothetical protein
MTSLPISFLPFSPTKPKASERGTSQCARPSNGPFSPHPLNNGLRRFCSQLRASNEGPLKPRVARARRANRLSPLPFIHGLPNKKAGASDS